VIVVFAMSVNSSRIDETNKTTELVTIHGNQYKYLKISNINHGNLSIFNEGTSRLEIEKKNPTDTISNISYRIENDTLFINNITKQKVARKMRLYISNNIETMVCCNTNITCFQINTKALTLMLYHSNARFEQTFQKLNARLLNKSELKINQVDELALKKDSLSRVQMFEPNY
jgi:hypothetical protein